MTDLKLNITAGEKINEGGPAENATGGQPHSRHAENNEYRLGGFGELFPNWMVTRPAGINLPPPLTLLLIGLVLISATLAPLLASNFRMVMLVIGAVFGIFGAVMLFKWPIIGLVSLPVLSLVVPFSISTGSYTGINISALMIILLTGVWLLGMIVQEHQVRLLPYRPMMGSLVFLVVVMVAFSFGQFNWFPTKSAPITAQIGGVMIFVLSICAFWIYAHLLKSIRELQWITWVFFGIGFLFIYMRMFKFLDPYVDMLFIPDASLGSVFFLWLISLAVGQLFFNQNLATIWRVLLGIGVGFYFYENMGIARFWVSGWLPVVASLIVMLLITKPRLGIILGVLGLIVFMVVPGLLNNLMNEGDNTYSIVTRLEAWQILWKIIQVSPLLGVGMANYYWYTSMFQILGYRVQFNSHNNYIDIIAQTGIIGLLVYLWLLWEIFRLGWRTLAVVPDGFAKAYMISAIGGLAGTLVAGMLGDWVIPFVYNVGLNGFRASVFAWLFLGGLVAVARLYLPMENGSDVAQRLDTSHHRAGALTQ